MSLRCIGWFYWVCVSSKDPWYHMNQVYQAYLRCLHTALNGQAKKEMNDHPRHMNTHTHKLKTLE